MHRKIKKISVCLLVVPMLTIATAGAWRNRCTSSTYYENLTVHRKRFKPPPLTQQPIQPKRKHQPNRIASVYVVTDQLDYLLLRKREASKQVAQIPGYAVQVYKGGSREVAFRIKNRLDTHYPTIIAKIAYDAPHYTVQLGEFLDKLEAYSAYAKIKKSMPQAIIRPIYFANQPDTFTGEISGQ